MSFAWLNNVFRGVLGGLYATAPATLATNTTGSILTDSVGRPVIVLTSAGSPVTSQSAPTEYVSSADSLGAIIVATPATLLRLTATASGTAPGWLAIYDQVSGTVTIGSTPTFSIPITPGQSATIELPRGRAYKSGIVWQLWGSADLSSGAMFSAATVTAQYLT